MAEMSIIGNKINMRKLKMEKLKTCDGVHESVQAIIDCEVCTKLLDEMSIN